MRWMIYGATGFSGQLVAEEAVVRGHSPIIAGRNVDKLRALSEQLDLEYAAFYLDDVATIAEAIADVDVVYHAAGPFAFTSDPMIRACLATKTHYLDINSEINVFQNTFRYDDAARKNGIALISGVGFDVIATDCLGLYVAQQVNGASHLEIGFTAYAISAGTSKSLLEMLRSGGMAREEGRLVAVPFGHKTRTLPLAVGEQPALAVPWGDVITSYRSTGVPNITTYMAMPQPIITLAKLTAPIGRRVAGVNLGKTALGRAIELFLAQPEVNTRQSTHTYLWASASNRSGQTAQAWLETLQPYLFTAKAAVLTVERTMELNPIGALSPAQAFGADLVLEIEGTRRRDRL